LREQNITAKNQIKIDRFFYNISPNKMEEDINIIRNFFNKSCDDLSQEDISIVAKLIKTDEITITNNPIILCYYAKFANQKTKINEMKNYYHQAIELGSTKAMNQLAYYYRKEEINPNEMKKLYLKAIQRNDIESMYDIADYYFETEQYDLMKKCAHKAIRHGSKDAMFALGLYYELIERDFKMIKRYYIMAIEHGYSSDRPIFLKFKENFKKYKKQVELEMD